MYFPFTPIVCTTFVFFKLFAPQTCRANEYGRGPLSCKTTSSTSFVFRTPTLREDARLCMPSPPLRDAVADSLTLSARRLTLTSPKGSYFNHFYLHPPSVLLFTLASHTNAKVLRSLHTFFFFFSLLLFTWHNYRAGELTAEDIEKVVTILSHPRQFKIPDWFLNRQKDIRDGKSSQLTSNFLDVKLRDDLERLKKIR